jgi:hypothetical protein
VKDESMNTAHIFTSPSLTWLTSVALLFAALPLAGCGGDDTPGVLPAPAATQEPAPTTPAPLPTPKRTLLTGGLTPTRAQNLLLDPGFWLTEQGQQGQGTFLAFYASSSSRLDIAVRTLSDSPAGFGGGVALLKDPKATDDKSRSIQLIANFTGGKGPFEASVWISSVDAAGAPRPFPEDGGGFEATILDARQSSSAVLKLDPEKTMVVGKRTWVQFRGTLKKDLVGGGLIAVETGAKGGGFEAAAPEIIALPTLAATSTTSLSRQAPEVTWRPVRADERATFAAYAAIPKRYVPAGRDEAGPPVPRPALAAKGAKARK